MKIYKLPASDNFWVRYFLDGKRITRSTNTTNKADAKKFAKEFFNEILHNKYHGIDSTKRKKSSFIACAEGVIEEDRLMATRNELSESYVKTQKQIIRNYIAEFFKPYEIADVDYTVLNSFKSFLFDKELSSGTVKTHFSAIKKILNYAERTKQIKAQPIFPKVKQEHNPRAPFSLLDYRELHKETRKLVGQTFEIRQHLENGRSKKIRNVLITKELTYLIGFMTYTFIRPSDIKTIKHKHLAVKDGKHGKYLWMPIPETKKHNKGMVSMPRAHYYYRLLVELRRKNGSPAKPDDFLFQPDNLNRDYGYRVLARQLDIVLENAGLKETEEGVTRSMYSLRHTGIMFRAMYGQEISSLKLAKNARTTEAMLEKYYLSKLENSDSVDVLHARKPPKNRKNSSTFFTAMPNEIDLANAAKSTDPRLSKIKLNVDEKGIVRIKGT